jgi:predicted dehydrogenase
MKPIRIAVVGAGRGAVYARAAAALPELLRLELICDAQPQALAHWRDQGIRTVEDFQHVLEDPDIDAVCIATPILLHAAQSVAALKAGKHVLCEVPAVWTLDEGRQLLETVQQTGLTYMMAENCCYCRPMLVVQEMIRRGVFGELTYAEGDYLSPAPGLLFTPEGDLTWRGRLYRDEFCNTYPTHSLGPVCLWLGVNRGETLERIATWRTKTQAAAHYARRIQSPDEALYDPAQWRLPDGMVTVINTHSGTLINHRLDWVSPRPAVGNRYLLQGTNAAFLWDRSVNPEPLIWISGRSAENAPLTPASWEPLEKYASEFEHPLWREHGAAALKVSPVGDDYMVLRDFAEAILERSEPLFNVHDALTASAISPLSRQSLEQNSAPVEVPLWLQNTNA